MSSMGHRAGNRSKVNAGGGCAVTILVLGSVFTSIAFLGKTAFGF